MGSVLITIDSNIYIYTHTHTHTHTQSITTQIQEYAILLSVMHIICTSITPVLMLNCNYFRLYGLFIALPPYSSTFTHTVYRFLYCVIDCMFVYSMCNCVVECVALLCFILARSQLYMRTCSQLSYLVK